MHFGLILKQTAVGYTNFANEHDTKLPNRQRLCHARFTSISKLKNLHAEVLGINTTKIDRT